MLVRTVDISCKIYTERSCYSSTISPTKQALRIATILTLDWCKLHNTLLWRKKLDKNLSEKNDTSLNKNVFLLFLGCLIYDDKPA